MLVTSIVTARVGAADCASGYSRHSAFLCRSIEVESNASRVKFCVKARAACQRSCRPVVFCVESFIANVPYQLLRGRQRDSLRLSVGKAREKSASRGPAAANIDEYGTERVSFHRDTFTSCTSEHSTLGLKNVRSCGVVAEVGPSQIYPRDIQCLILPFTAMLKPHLASCQHILHALQELQCFAPVYT